MSTHNQRLGAFGEATAAAYLAERGYEIVERNWRCAAGEVDIVAKECGGPVCLVEVKTRSSASFGHAAESITQRKLARMRAVAGYWRRSKGGPHPIRLDLICVDTSGATPQVWHLAGVDR